MLGHSSPVFIFGSPCSDASVLATALTASEDFWCSTESHLFYYLVGPDTAGQSKLHAAYQHASQDASFWLPKNRVVYQELAAYLGLGLDQLFRSRSNGRRWVEASPENTLIATELAYLFPKARFINIVRDGRDAVSLMESADATPEEFTSACETWRIYAERGLEFQERFPRRVYELRHEQLVHNTRSESHKILDFLSAARGDAIASYFSSGRPPFQERLWKGWSAERRQAFSDAAGAMMSDLGYPLMWT